MKCRICNSENTYNHLHGKYELTTCRECKISYNSKFPLDSDIEEFYKSQYNLNDINDLYDNERRRYFRFPENISLISDILRYAKPPSSILDIGCNYGYFIDEARRYGYNVFGVELSEDARKFNKAIHLDVRANIAEFDRKFNVATMWHSLEHIYNPVEYLTEVRNHLHNPSYLFVRVPDFGSYWSNFLKDKWDWFLPNYHLFHYNIESIEFLLKKVGFVIERIVQRKPNNGLTKRAFSLSNDAFELTFDNRLLPRKKYGRKILDIVHSEIYVIAKLEYVKK